MKTMRMLRFFSSCKSFLDLNYQNLTIQSGNKLDSLINICNIFADNQIKMAYIKSQFSRSNSQEKRYILDISIEKQPQEKIMTLRQEFCKFGAILSQEKPILIPWFPRKVSDLDFIGKTLLTIRENEANKDHPQFADKEYRIRRNFISQVAHNYKMGDRIPDVPYTKNQHDLWSNINERLNAVHSNSMSKRYLKQKQKFEKEVGFVKKIPQLSKVNDYLRSKTGITFKPTHGILSQREFLNCLAFKVFCCTQYIRHVSDPDYTPEPDIVHEIVGHVPMLADPYVAEISQKIGIISLGATDQQIAQLGALYIFTIQFGAELQGEKKVAYGAGIASCVAEINHFMGNKSIFKKLDPIIDSKDIYPIQSVQPCYRYTESFEEALQQLDEFGQKHIIKPVTMRFNHRTNTVQYDRNIELVDSKDKAIKFV